MVIVTDQDDHISVPRAHPDTSGPSTYTLSQPHPDLEETSLFPRGCIRRTTSIHQGMAHQLRYNGHLCSPKKNGYIRMDLKSRAPRWYTPPRAQQYALTQQAARNLTPLFPSHLSLLAPHPLQQKQGEPFINIAPGHPQLANVHP